MQCELFFVHFELHIQCDSQYATVSIMMFSFGFIITMQGLTHNLGGLLTTHFFSSILEACHERAPEESGRA